MFPRNEVHTLYTESGFACVEFILFPNTEEVQVQTYGTKFCKKDLKSWLAPDAPAQYLTKEHARRVYADYLAKGYGKRG